MIDPNNSENKREVSEENYTDSNGQIHTQVKKTTETVNNGTSKPNSYQSGYVQGRSSERSHQESNLAERDTNNVLSGWLLGLLFVSIVGLSVGTIWYFNQRNNVVPVLVPVPNDSSSSPKTSTSPQSNQSKTTIIERTKEVPVLVPQQPVAVPSPPPQPPINITVKSEQPKEKSPAATQSTPKQSLSPTIPTSSNPAQQNGNNTSTITKPQNVDQSQSTPSKSQDANNSNSAP